MLPSCCGAGVSRCGMLITVAGLFSGIESETNEVAGSILLVLFDSPRSFLQPPSLTDFVTRTAEGTIGDVSLDRIIGTSGFDLLRGRCCRSSLKFMLLR